MTDTKATQCGVFETELDDFEDVALLLEPDLEQQQHSRDRPSLKSRFLEFFARGGSREHTGFDKLNQTEDSHEVSGRKEGTSCALTSLHSITPGA